MKFNQTVVSALKICSLGSIQLGMVSLEMANGNKKAQCFSCTCWYLLLL